MDPPRITYHHEIEQGTPQWNDIRRGVITASGMSALITPTGKPASNDASRSYLRKLLAERITNLTESGYYSDDMARGHMLEPLARYLYSLHHKPVTECGFIKKDYGSFCIGFSPDGLVGDAGFIEIKSRLGKHHIASMFDKKVPSEYVVQVQTGLAVSGREWADYVSFCPGLPFLAIPVFRNEPLITTIESAAARAEEQLQEMMEQYLRMAEAMPPTEPIQPEQEMIL
jgi:hypothetical protein